MAQVQPPKPQYPAELNITLSGSIDVGRQREELFGSVRLYPNDGEYLFSLGLVSQKPLSMHGGYPVLSQVLSGLAMFPADLRGGSDVTGPVITGPAGTDQPPDQPPDKPPDQPPGGEEIAGGGEFTSIFEDGGLNIIDLGIGEYEFELGLSLLGQTSMATGAIVRTSAAEFTASLRVVSNHSFSRTGDLIRLLPLDTVLIPTEPGLLHSRTEPHFLQGDGLIVSGQLSGHYKYKPGSSQPHRHPLFFSHSFAPVLLSKAQTSVRVDGRTRSLILRPS
jgi:hypothetical protein